MKQKDIADGLVELVGHSRWLCSHALSFVDAAYQEEYPEDFELAQRSLSAMSKPMAHVERLLDVPADTFTVLCDGVLYLLVAESILGQAPPTMHQFLRQGTISGNRDRQQTHLLVVRWLSTAGLIDLNELEAVVFGGARESEQAGSSVASRPVTGGASQSGMTPTFVTPISQAESGSPGSANSANRSDPHSATLPLHSPPRFANTLELQSAIAANLAESEPFYLGAHITVLRALLLRYCNELTGIEDVQGHIDCILPPPSPSARSQSTGRIITEPKVIDDAVLAWIHAVLSLSIREPTSPTSHNTSGATTTAGPLLDPTAIEDVYLHTNDGRALALVVHHYRPDLLPISHIHMLHPLTVWQRHDNWSSVIRAAEQLELWVGIFPEEYVSHGFSTLQLHVLRFIEELFVVLAGDAENKFTELAEEMELNAETTFVDVNASQLSVSQGIRRSQMPELRSSYAGARMPEPSQAAVAPQQQPPAADGLSPAERFNIVRPHTVHDGTFPVKGGADSVEQASISRTEDESSTSAASPKIPGAEDTIHNAAHTVTPSTHLRTSHLSPHLSYAGTRHAEFDEAEETDDAGDEGQDESSYSIVMTSLVLNGFSMPIHKVPAAAKEPPTPQAIVAAPVEAPERNEVLESTGFVPLPETAEAPPRSKSPEMHSGRRSSLSHGGGGSARGSATAAREINPLTRSFAAKLENRRVAHPANPLVRSMAHFKTQRESLDAAGLHQTAPGRQVASASVNLVQGSVDAEGVEELLDELANLPVPRTDAPKGTDAESLHAQNVRLRMALDQQRRAVRDIVGRLRSGLHQRDFDTVLKHLQRHGVPVAHETEAQAQPQPPPQLSPNALMTYTPTLAALAALAASESQEDEKSVPKAAHSATAAPSPQVVEKSAAAASQQQQQEAPSSAPSEQDEAARRAGSLALLRGRIRPGHVPENAPVPASAPSSQQPLPPRAAPAPPPPSTAPSSDAAQHGSPSKGMLAAALAPRASAFDVSLGASVGVTGGSGPQLTGAQLQRLKQRHAERRVQAAAAEAKAVAAGPVKPGRLPSLPNDAEGGPSENQSNTSGATKEELGVPHGRQHRSASVTAAMKVHRNNRGQITNALKHVCLPGACNKPQLDATIGIIEGGDSEAHFVVLLKDEYNKQFRGLYQYRPGTDALTRVFGAGPLTMRAASHPSAAADAAAEANQPSKYFKFDTGGKKFMELPATMFNQMTDAVTLPPRTRNSRPPL
jgi:hypothetical protein